MIINRETKERMMKEAGGCEVFINKQKNPGGYRKRLRENIKESIEDLVYFTAQLPYNEFFYDSIGLNLQVCLFHIAAQEYELCSGTIETCKNLLMIEYEERNKKDYPTITNITKEYLEKASSICREIAIKMKVDDLEEKKEKKKLSDYEGFQLQQLKKEQQQQQVVANYKKNHTSSITSSSISLSLTREQIITIVSIIDDYSVGEYYNKDSEEEKLKEYLEKFI